MDFRKIEYFIQVAECLNFSKAAERIHMSHQGLSKQIRLLEQELGAALFERSTTHVILTDVGKRMYDAFRPIVEDANRSYEKIEDYVRLRKSMLLIGYFNALSFQQVVDPVVKYLQQKKPDLGIDLFATDIGDARERFMSDRMDLLITVMISKEDWKNVCYYCLATIPLKIIVSYQHPWYQKETVTEDDLKEDALLYYEKGSEAFMKNLRVKNRISMQNYDSYMGRLLAGKEFGIVADIYSRREGQFKLFDLPPTQACNAWIIAAFKKEHPLNSLMKQIEKMRLD